MHRTDERYAESKRSPLSRREDQTLQSEVGELKIRMGVKREFVSPHRFPNEEFINYGGKGIGVHRLTSGILRQLTFQETQQNTMEEYAVRCPYCWQTITMLVDLSVPEQEYVEDCEVCCRPLEIKAVVEDDQIVQFEVQGAA